MPTPSFQATARFDPVGTLFSLSNYLAVLATEVFFVRLELSQYEDNALKEQKREMLERINPELAVVRDEGFKAQSHALLFILERYILVDTPVDLLVEMESRILRVSRVAKQLWTYLFSSRLVNDEVTDRNFQPILDLERESREAVQSLYRLSICLKKTTDQIKSPNSGTTKRKPGRKRKYDPQKDAQLKAAWVSGAYTTYADLEREKNLKDGDVERTLARLRKPPKTAN